MAFDRRQFLRGGGAALAGVLGASSLATSTSAWKGIEIDAYCKGYLLAKLEVEGGEFALDESEHGERVGDGLFKVYNHYFDLDVDAHLDDEGEVASVDFATDSDVVDHAVVKGGPQSVHYLENPLDSPSAASGLQGPVNPRASDDGSTRHYAVSNVEFRRCTGIAVDVTSTSSVAKPAEVLDLTADDIRLGVTYSPWRHDDQHVFDRGAETKHGNGHIQGDGNVHLYFPYGESFVDDPAEVGDPSQFQAQLLVEGADGDTWAGSDSLPPIL